MSFDLLPPDLFSLCVTAMRPLITPMDFYRIIRVSKPWQQNISARCFAVDCSWAPWCNEMTGLNFRALMARTPNLKQLSLHGCHALFEREDSEAIPTSVIDLDLSHTRYTNEDVCLLIRRLDHLRSITLQSTATQDSLKPLFAAIEERRTVEECRIDLIGAVYSIQSLLTALARSSECLHTLHIRIDVQRLEELDVLTARFPRLARLAVDTPYRPAHALMTECSTPLPSWSQPSILSLGPASIREPRSCLSLYHGTIIAGSAWWGPALEVLALHDVAMNDDMLRELLHQCVNLRVLDIQSVPGPNVRAHPRLTPQAPLDSPRGTLREISVAAFAPTPLCLDTLQRLAVNNMFFTEPQAGATIESCRRLSHLRISFGRTTTFQEMVLPNLVHLGLGGRCMPVAQLSRWMETLPKLRELFLLATNTPPEAIKPLLIPCTRLRELALAVDKKSFIQMVDYVKRRYLPRVTDPAGPTPLEVLCLPALEEHGAVAALKKAALQHGCRVVILKRFTLALS
ncbi:hypothetical protein PAPYR_5385 [Paratrimastix pyriformis]|uniref:F-box domain-containing protein n=1 Tax=Paratrimastix pyriformis TaxID=342808 RepID=A0ABQ8UKA4_9EUKA|nr:hypothetical protein PAPYR_5385 [Paratrimastix pyriformis]